MADTVSPEVRARMMSANGRRDTKPELFVRRFIHARGFRFRLDVGSLPGRPDIVLRRWNAAIFVHGCYWHRHPGCRFATTPKSNVEFWTAKFDRNRERDQAAVAALLALGWRVAVVWECGLRGHDRLSTLEGLTSWLSGDDRYAELPAARSASPVGDSKGLPDSLSTPHRDR